MVATRTDSTLGTNFTQATLVAAIKTAMIAAGFSAPIDEYISGTDRLLVYPFVTDATKTYGTVYYRIRVSSNFGIATGFYTTWNSATHFGNTASSEFTFNGLVNTNSINFLALNGGLEYKFLFITQVNTLIPLGIIAPTSKPNWWDLNNWNYAFFFNGTNLNSFAGSNTSPYGNGLYTILLNGSLMLNVNQQTGNTDVLTGLILLSNTGRGIAGKTSDDLGLACVLASSRYNTISSDTANQNYLIINPAGAGLVIKVQS